MITLGKSLSTVEATYSVQHDWRCIQMMGKLS